MPFGSLQQNLNQISTICHQLSQSEHANAVRLQQMQQAEQMASQQLQQCAMLCNQVAHQMMQLSNMTQINASQASAHYGAYRHQ
ncbi:MAG: hypothetical protein ACM3QZ_03165 [Solirubrobacterales bacterium]